MLTENKRESFLRSMCFSSRKKQIVILLISHIVLLSIMACIQILCNTEFYIINMVSLTICFLFPLIIVKPFKTKSAIMALFGGVFTTILVYIAKITLDCLFSFVIETGLPFEYAFWFSIVLSVIIHTMFILTAAFVYRLSFKKIGALAITLFILSLVVEIAYQALCSFLFSSANVLDFSNIFKFIGDNVDLIGISENFVRIFLLSLSVSFFALNQNRSVGDISSKKHER